MPEEVRQLEDSCESQTAISTLTSSNSSQGAYGWEFQKAAGLLLMLELLKECKSLNVEGPTEDIELDLGQGRMIYAQAKSMEQDCPTSLGDKNFYNRADEDLAKSIKTLAAACKKAKDNNVTAAALIYISNIEFPFSRHNETVHRFRGGDCFEYKALSDIEKKKVSDKLRLCKQKDCLPEFKEKFEARRMVFPNVQNAITRYREIYDALQNILNVIGMPDWTSRDLLDRVRGEIDSVTIKDVFHLSKDAFISMILEIQMRLMDQQLNEIFNKKFSPRQCHRIIKLYRETIASHCLSYQLSNEINSLYLDEYPEGYYADNMLEFAMNNPSIVDNCVSIQESICEEQDVLLVKAALIYKVLDERMVFSSVQRNYYE